MVKGTLTVPADGATIRACVWGSTRTFTDVSLLFQSGYELYRFRLINAPAPWRLTMGRPKRRKIVMNWEPVPPESIVGIAGEPDHEVGVLKLVSADKENKVLAQLSPGRATAEGKYWRTQGQP